MAYLGRKVWGYKAVWAASGAAPTITEIVYDTNDVPQLRKDTVTLMNAVHAGGCRVFLPTDLPATVDGLKFLMSHDPDGTPADTQDYVGNAEEITGLQSSKGYYRDFPTSQYTMWFVTPRLLNSGSAVIEPGACTLYFLFKE